MASQQTLGNSESLSDTSSHSLVGIEDFEITANDASLTVDQKKDILQKALFAASSNGDLTKIQALLTGDKIAQNIDINAKDDKGSSALIYSCCFGHDQVVKELLRAGADTESQDNHEWTALMWAINNKHLAIVQSLIENGADLNISTSSGRTALNFVSPGDEIYQYLKAGGYIEEEDGKDFYQEVKDPRLLEDEFTRQLEESAANLDTSMTNLALGTSAAAKTVGYGLFNDVDVDPKSEDDTDDEMADIEEYTYGEEGFIWDRCLPDQMFVFREPDIPKILDLAITEIAPQRSRRQKPIPANMIFLSARYAHYFGSKEMLENLLEPVVVRIRSIIFDRKQDIAYLSFWLSNCSLLLYYFTKDPGLKSSTSEFRQQIEQLIGDLYILITQDVENRLDKTLDVSILDHETIPGLDTIHYQSDWGLFRRKAKQLTHKEEVEQVTRPPSPKRKARPSPRTITSTLSSLLFMMDLYEVHPVLEQQVISQVLYWLGAVLFNRILANRKYLARSKAMQIRLNISAIEDWARANNRRPKDADEFNTSGQHYYESTAEICRRHFASLAQILQWLQCFTGFGDDFTNVIATLQQLTALNPMQLTYVAGKYRAEVGEKGLSKEYKKYLADLQNQYNNEQKVHIATVDVSAEDKREVRAGEDKVEKKEDEMTENADNSDKADKIDKTDKTDEKVDKTDEKTDKTDAESDKKSVKAAVKNDTKETIKENKPENQQEILGDKSRPHVHLSLIPERRSEEKPRQTLYLDASHVLPLVLPTQQEMIITWGAGLGGTHKRRARKHEPVLPADFIDKFEDEIGFEGSNSNTAEAVTTINPVFGDLTVPAPSVHKGWGEDPEIDDLNGGWADE